MLKESELLPSGKVKERKETPFRAVFDEGNHKTFGCRGVIKRERGTAGSRKERGITHLRAKGKRVNSPNDSRALVALAPRREGR